MSTLKVDNLNAQPATTRNYEDLEEFEQIYAVGNPRGFIGKTAGGKITRLYNFVPPVSWLQKIFASGYFYMRAYLRGAYSRVGAYSSIYGTHKLMKMVKSGMVGKK